MAVLAHSILSTKTLIVCFGLFSESSSGTLAVLTILLLFVVFLAPFDRRLLERYIQRLGARASLKEGNRSGKLMTGAGVSETSMPGGPFTRQLCKMLDLEVVDSRGVRSWRFGSRPVGLAIGRWNREARQFEVVTEWRETWEDLEEEARQAMKSFRGIANVK
jgi:hypothetical protein